MSEICGTVSPLTYLQKERSNGGLGIFCFQV